MSTRPPLARQTAAVVRLDMVRERRRGEVAWVTLPFGALAILLFPMAIGIDSPTLHRIGPGLFWVVVLLFGVMVTVRRTAMETVSERDLAARLGLDPAAMFLGRAISATVFLLVFEVVVGLVAVTLYDLQVQRWPWLLVIVPGVAAGIGMLGTIAGSISAGRGGGALVPFLVAPLAVPLLLGATQALDDGLTATDGILAWTLLIVLVDLALAVVGVLTARPLQETQ